MEFNSLNLKLLTHTAQTQVAVTSDSNHPRLLQIAGWAEDFTNQINLLWKILFYQ